MNKQLRFSDLLMLVFSGLIFCSSILADSENEKKKGSRRSVEGRREQARKPSIADLSSEDREGVKKILRVVWEKAEILQARDEVKRATETFRSAVHEAMLQEDPRLAGLMQKLHDEGKRPPGRRGEPGLHLGSHHGSRPEGDLQRGGRPSMKKMRAHRDRAMAGLAIGPVGLKALPKDFSQEDKERLAAAQEKAMQTEAYKTSREKLQGLFKQGEELRKLRVQMFQQIREQLRQQMIEADPEVLALLERLEKNRSKKDRASSDSK